MKSLGKFLFVTATLTSALFIIKSIVSWSFKKKDGYYHFDGI